MDRAATGDHSEHTPRWPHQTFGAFTEASGATAIVWLSGDCDASVAQPLRATLQPLVENGMRQVRLDMEQVTFLDSVALSVILEARAQLQPSGHLEVTQPSVPVTRLLRAAGFGAVLGDADRHLTELAALEQRIDLLTEPQQEVLSEYFGERRPIDDVAARLQVSRHQAKELLAEALRALEARHPPIGG